MMSRCKVICICTTLERGQGWVAKFHNSDSLKFMVFHLPGPLGAPPHARSLRGSQTILLPPPASSSPNHTAQIPESSQGPRGSRACRGTQQEWPLFQCVESWDFSAEASPEDQSFPDFRFPPWHAQKTSETPVGGGGLLEGGEGDCGWGRGVQGLNELQICLPLETTISLGGSLISSRAVTTAIGSHPTVIKGRAPKSGGGGGWFKATEGLSTRIEAEVSQAGRAPARLQTWALATQSSQPRPPFGGHGSSIYPADHTRTAQKLSAGVELSC